MHAIGAAHSLLHDSSEPVYLAFFTLTGAALQLGSLVGSLPAATLTFALRLVGIVAGTRLGGHFGNAPPEHTDTYWMASRDAGGRDARPRVARRR